MRYRLFIFTALILAPILTSAQYTPLVGLPYINGNQDIGAYVNALYLLAIAVAAFLAVIKIIFGGVNYMLSDVVTDKSQAKKDIKGALLGLLIVLAAVLVLNTINPSLTNLNIFRNALEMEFDSSGSVTLGLVGEGKQVTLEDIVNDPNDSRYGSTPTITSCDTPNTQSCQKVMQDCMNNPNYNTVQQTGPNSITCFLGTADYTTCPLLVGCRQWCLDQGGTPISNGLQAPGCQIDTNNQPTANDIAGATAFDQDTCLGGGGAYTGTGLCRTSRAECTALGGIIDSTAAPFEGFPNEVSCLNP